jgi:hypothetical protein
LNIATRIFDYAKANSKNCYQSICERADNALDGQFKNSNKFLHCDYLFFSFMANQIRPNQTN